MELKPGYKQTEVGVIPEDWDVKRIGDLGTIVRGGSPRPAGDSRYFNGKFIPWLTVGSLTNIPKSQLYVESTNSMLTEAGMRHSRVLEPDTLIISNSGATLGVAKILGIKCCANDGVAAIIDQKKGDKVFLAQYINTKTKELHDNVATGNGQPNLNRGLISNILVPFPSENEQKLIGQALSDMDALIQSLEQQIIKKQQIKQGATHSLLNPYDKDGKRKSGWIKTMLGRIGTFSKGSGVTKEQALSGNIPCIRYGELYTRHNNVITSFQSYISESVSVSAVKLKQGDILFAGSGETKEDIGKCAAFVMNLDAYAGGDIVIMRPNIGQDPTFLGYFLNTEPVRRQKSSKGQGDAVVHISANALSAIEVTIPDTQQEQAEIGRVFNAMSTEIAELQTKLVKHQKLKQGMMQNLLTGTVRLV